VCNEFGGLFLKEGEWFQRRLTDMQAVFAKLQASTASKQAPFKKNNSVKK